MNFSAIPYSEFHSSRTPGSIDQPLENPARSISGSEMDLETEGSAAISCGSPDPSIYCYYRSVSVRKMSGRYFHSLSLQLQVDGQTHRTGSRPNFYF